MTGSSPMWTRVVSRTQPKQYEFARLNIGYTVMSKRMLRQLVEKDPRGELG